MELDTPILLSPDLTSHAMASKLDLQLSLRDNSSPILKRVDAETNSYCSQPQEEDESDEEANEEEDDGDDCDFSFVCSDASSPISAEDLFDNGQIKPIFPWLGQEPPDLADEETRLTSLPVKKVFVERSGPHSEAEDFAEGPYCAWSKSTESARDSTSACRKSNSTGFSKLRRFRDLLHRSHSDGKDTFVFLTKPDKEEATSLPSSSKKKKTRRNLTFRKGKKKDWGKAESKTTPSPKSKTTPSAKSKTTPSLSSYALQYGKNGERAKEKRKSYLPYRQDLVGFFTSANTMSKNIHPY